MRRWRDLLAVTTLAVVALGPCNIDKSTSLEEQRKDWIEIGCPGIGCGWPTPHPGGPIPGTLEG